MNTPEGSYCAECVLFSCAAEEAIREAVELGLCVSREINPAMEGMMNVSCPPEQLMPLILNPTPASTLLRIDLLPLIFRQHLIFD